MKHSTTQMKVLVESFTDRMKQAGNRVSELKDKVEDLEHSNKYRKINTKKV
jgi:hypothetical protein